MTNSDQKFKQVRLKLTLGYTLFFIVVICIFSTAFHYSQLRVLLHSQHRPMGIMLQIHNLNRPLTPEEKQELSDNLNTRFELITAELRQDLLENILFFDFLAIAACIGISYWLAGFTLQPLQDSYRLQQQFLQDASHELRTPLSIIRSEVDLALKKKASPANTKTFESIKEEVISMTELVSDILLLARSGQTNHRAQEKVDLNKVTKKLITKFTPQARAKDQSLKFITDKTSNIWIMVNPDYLLRLISILLENAIKHTPHKSSIECRLGSEGKTALLQVIDNGPGISQEEQTKIFERFYRADQARTSVGNGLGLAIAQKLAHHLQAKLTLKSQLGQGSTFSLKIPLAS